MFNPSRDQVRQFFFDTWAKYRRKEPLAGLETFAIDVILLHPEYQPLLDDPANAARDYGVEGGEMNPFLHLSLHLAIEEQVSIDQPPGIRAALSRLAERRGDRHDALHGVLDCLGQMVWKSQRENRPPDGAAYLECVRKLA